MRQIVRRPWTTSTADGEDMAALIAAAAQVPEPARLPAPSRRSHVVLFPMDGSRRGLSILAPKVRMRWLLPAMVVWTLGIGSLLLANRSSTMPGLPRELWGTWVADQADNSTGAITLGDRSITFQAGPDANGATTHAVTSVRWSRQGAGVQFVVDYVNGLTAAVHGRFTFLYVGPPSGERLVSGATGLTWHRALPARVASR